MMLPSLPLLLLIEWPRGEKEVEEDEEEATLQSIGSYSSIKLPVIRSLLLLLDEIEPY